MGKHIVRVVEDNTLDGDGWAMAMTDDGDLFFIVERSAAAEAQVLMDAWEAAAKLERENATMREAVRRGHGPAA